uniref:Uncharacterized protein n=1 Tax=Arundo donax TaxID=35708 RepID=A0A0A8XSS4_ARUDO
MFLPKYNFFVRFLHFQSPNQ